MFYSQNINGQVKINHFFPSICREIFNRLGLENSGIGDHDVEFTKIRDCGINHFYDLNFVGDICIDAVGLSTIQLFYQLYGFVDAGLLNIHYHHMAAFFF